MPSTSISYSQTGYFSKTMSDYLKQDSSLESFYGKFPTLKGIKQQLEEKQKNFSKNGRSVLVSQLEKQYQDFVITQATQDNINALSKSSTFTVTTGHQLNLFTGPMYYIYKILSVINLTEQLTRKYPENSFVPVFWMATEDHDFQEINGFNFKGNKIKWDTNQSGPVGRFSTKVLQELVTVLKTEFGQTTNGRYLLDLFQKAYTQNDTLAQATRFITNALFGSYGIVVLDGDDRRLKKQFISYVEAELFAKKGHKEISNTTQRLVSLGYPQQVHPREINLFYIKDELRERIIEKDGMFLINNTSMVFSKAQMQKQLSNYPERFSPNALLRPLYQEVVLPNLCYVGGGGELAYWFQLKDYFESVGVTFPVLLLRNSAILANIKLESRLKKLDVSVQDIFKKDTALSSWFVNKVSNIPIDFSSQQRHLEKQFEHLYTIAGQTDASFLGAVAAQQKKQTNGLLHLEKRLLNAQKRKHADQLSRLIRLRSEIFPQGGLQERVANFSEFYLEYGTSLLPTIKENLKPLEGKFTFIYLP